jgi:hypothetical protein
MKPDRYECLSTGPRRLSGTLQRRGVKLGLPVWGGFLFGGVFVAVGTVIVLIGTKVLPVNPASVHAPWWVLTVFGVSFAAGGLMVWAMAGRQLAADRRRAQAIEQFPNDPALADYPWHSEGFEVSEWVGVAKSAALAVGITVFLSMFNWWAFGAGGPLMVKIITGLFDLMALGMWGQTGWKLIGALKFGRSRVGFARFPYSTSEPVILRWHSAQGISQVRKGSFTLRCVKEWMEVTGNGKNQNRTLVHEELWSAKWLLEQPRNLQLNEVVELRYDLPEDALPTQFSADMPVFWELEVKLDLPGPDFCATYLVPIYCLRGALAAQTVPVR